YRASAYRADADAALARLIEHRYTTVESIDDDIMFNIRLAEARAFRGASDQAFAALTQKKNALVEHWGKDAAVKRRHEYEAALSLSRKPLHADPRWQEFMAEPG